MAGDPRVQDILDRALADIAGARSTSALEQVRVRVLGRSGELTALLRGLGKVPAADRPRFGQEVNRAKERLEAELEVRLVALKAEEHRQALQAQRPDLTLTGRAILPGAVHPLVRVLDEIIEIFAGLGFSVAEGPEVETDYYNFAALNFPDDHPARDMQDTFHLSADTLLRTHTSPVQIRTMEANEPPIYVVAPGRTYRNETPGPRNSPVFHQMECLAVDRGITLADLFGTIEVFVKRLFDDESVRTRFRSDYFPYTEPSAELAVSCIFCHGEGCRVCSFTGWIELGGCGMVDPNVFEAVGYDPEEWQGFAFGFGL